MALVSAILDESVTAPKSFLTPTSLPLRNPSEGGGENLLFTMIINKEYKRGNITQPNYFVGTAVPGHPLSLTNSECF